MTGPEVTAVLRIARRTAWRQRWRTLLIVLLVAVPVAAAGVTAAFMRAGELTPEERATQRVGAADLEVFVFGGDPDDVTAFVRGQLGSADITDSLHVREGEVLLDGRHLTLRDLDLSHPLSAGMVEVVEGRAATAADEVVLSTFTAGRANLAVGDHLTFDGVETPVTLVGLAEDPANLRRPLAFTTSSGLDRLAGTGVLDTFDEGAHGLLPRWLVASPRPDEVANSVHAAAHEAFGEELEEYHAEQEAMEQGDLPAATPLGGADGPPQVEVRTRADIVRGWSSDTLADALWRPETVATGVAGLLLIEVVFIAGAAFATGARRRLRELGLLASGGATITHLRAVVVLEAAVTGVVGAVAGIVLGIVVVTFGRPWGQLLISPRIEGIPLASLDLLGPIVVALLAVVAAAWLPARTAARVPTTTALQGRMPLSDPPRWITPVGIGITGFGALLAVAGFAGSTNTQNAVALIGVMLAVGGTALLTGPIVAFLGRRADRLPATLRLVVRDAARQRTRAATATSAALVLLLAPIALGVAYATSATQDLLWGLPTPQDHVLVGSPHLIYGDGFEEFGPTVSTTTTDPDPAVVDEVAATLGDGTRRAEMALLGGPDAFAWLLTDGAEVTDQVELNDGGGGGSIPDGTVPSSRVMTMARATPELVDVLEAPAVATAIEADGIALLGRQHRTVHIRLPDGRAHTATEVPIAVSRTSQFPRVLVSDEVATEVGLDERGSLALLVAPSPLNDPARQALQQLDNESTSVELPWGGGDTAWLPWAVVGIALLVVLVVLGLVTALSATESDRDLETMVAVGAKPLLRRRFLGLQSLLYAVVGGILAIPLGLGLNWATQAGRDYLQVGPFGVWEAGDLGIPWLLMIAIVAGIPLVSGLVTAATVRSTRPQPPRRIA